MGQNLALIWSSATLEDDRDSDFAGRIRKWFDEVKKYSYGAKFSLATGHYMQVSIVNCFPYETSSCRQNANKTKLVAIGIFNSGLDKGTYISNPRCL